MALQAAEEEEQKLSDIFNKTEMLVLVDKPSFWSFQEAAETLDVSVSSVSRAVDRLLELGFLQVEEIPLTHTGRPAKTIRLDYSKKIVQSLIEFIEEYHSLLQKMQETDNSYKRTTR